MTKTSTQKKKSISMNAKRTARASAKKSQIATSKKLRSSEVQEYKYFVAKVYCCGSGKATWTVRALNMKKARRIFRAADGAYPDCISEIKDFPQRHWKEG